MRILNSCDKKEIREGYFPEFFRLIYVNKKKPAGKPNQKKVVQKVTKRTIRNLEYLDSERQMYSTAKSMLIQRSGLCGCYTGDDCKGIFRSA